MSLYLVKEVGELLKVNPRLIQSWCDRGILIPKEQSRGQGFKRYFDYLNFVEIKLIYKLNLMGVGISRIKDLMIKIQDEDLIRNWIADPKEFFNEQRTLFWPIQSNPHKLKETITEPEISIYDFLLKIKPDNYFGVLFFGSIGISEHNCFILPVPKFPYMIEQKPEILRFFYYVYAQLGRGCGIIVDLSAIKDEVDNLIA